MSVKKLILARVLTILGVGLIAAPFIMDNKSSDEYLRDRVVLLQSSKASCSGVSVKAPSGKSYVLTAAHCVVVLSEQNEVQGTLEDGTKVLLHEVDIDAFADLMLLSDAGVPGLEVADKMAKHEKIHTMTHGRAMMSYRTDGEIVDRRDLHIMESFIGSDDDVAACRAKPEHDIGEGPFGLPVCAKTLHLTGMTAHVEPGSSGGPIVDSRNRLVGIVSATDGVFGYMVNLEDVKAFLANR